MQFKPAATGYEIAEIYRLESKQKLLKLDGKATFNWSNTNLRGIEEDTLSKYFALVGQEFFSFYKKTIKSWEDFAQKEIEKAEKAVLAVKDAQMKALKKMKSGTPADIQAAQRMVKDEADIRAAAVQTSIQNKYQELLPALAKKAHEAVVKKLGKAAGALKKSHGKAIFKAVMFTVAVAAVVLASIALGPLAGVALGIGIAAVTIKAIGVLSKGVKDLRNYIKQFNKISEKAAGEIDAAALAIDKAIKAMEACHSVRESLLLKIAGAKQELTKAQSGLGTEKEVAQIRKNIVKAQAELQELETFIGNNTGDVLNHLKDANKDMAVAKQKKPRKILGTVETLMDLVEQVGELAT